MLFFLTVCLLVAGASSIDHSIDNKESLQVTPDDREGIFQLILQPELDHPRESIYLQQINEHIQQQQAPQQQSKQSTPFKHQHHADYVNLLEEGAHAKVLAQVKTKAEMQIFRGALENIKRILQLVVAVSVTIGDHAYAGINAGVSLLGLGGGVSVGLNIELGVIPKLAGIITRFFGNYYEENHETSTMLSFLRSFQQKITALNKNKPACNKLPELLKSITIGFQIGVDVSLTRGVMSLGVALVLPTIGIHFGVPVARIGANGVACLSEMTASGLLYFGDRNPKWSGWARKGASALTGTSHAIRDLMNTFEGSDAVISVGHGIDIGKGAFGVGLGLTLSCQRKKESETTNAVDACTSTLKEIVGKIQGKIKATVNAALHPTRRRRLLRAVRRLKVLADHVEAVPRHDGDRDTDSSSLMSLIEVSKQHMDAATKQYQTLHDKEKNSPPAIKTTAFLEDMQMQKAHEKFVIITTLALVTIGRAIAVAVNNANSQDKMRDINHIETVLGPITNNAFVEGVEAEVQTDSRRCIDGISAGLDYINWSFGGGYFVGPLTHCFELACEKVLLKLRFGNQAKVHGMCTGYRTLAGNLLLEPPNWEQTKPASKAGGEDKALYRWKIFNPNEESGWSGEVDVDWGKETTQFEIPNVKGGKMSSMWLQFRVPRGHDVDLHILTTNSDKLSGFGGAYTDCILNKPWQGRSFGRRDGKVYGGTPCDTLSPEGKYQENRIIRVGPGGTAPRDCGGPGRKVGKGFQYKCSDTTNYFLSFNNLNEWQDTEIKFKFVKKKSPKCLWVDSDPDSSFEPVSIGTTVVEKYNNFQMSGGDTRYHYYQVVGRVDERIDETCCSKWCDGMYCSPPTEKALELFKSKGIAMEAPHGECKRTREFFRNQWEQRKAELTLIAPKDDAEREELTNDEAKKTTLENKQKQVETALLLAENDVISRCKALDAPAHPANVEYRLASIPHPDAENPEADLDQVVVRRRIKFQPVFEDQGDRAEWVEGKWPWVTKEEKERAELYEHPPTFFGAHPSDIPIDSDVVIDNNDAAPDQPSTETHEPVTSKPTQKDMDTISEEDRTKYLKELDDLEKKYYGVIPTEKLTELYGKYDLDAASLKERSRMYGMKGRYDLRDTAHLK